MPNAALVNFVAGETSQQSRGRFDLEWYRASLEKCFNFMVTVPGPVRYRPGFKHIAVTREGVAARLVPFQFNATQSYMLEFTPGKMRVYADGALQVIDRTTLTAVTNASPAVITVASTTGLINGDDIIITGVVGMEALNGRQVRLANKSGSTYELVDPVTGANIDSSAWGAWASGGVVAEIYEIDTPYLAGEISEFDFAQNRAVMYLTHPKYAPRKLQVDSGGTWTLGTYSRTNDPFTFGAALTVRAILRSGKADAGYDLYGDETIVVFSAGTISEGAHYAFAGVGGTVEINGQSYYGVIITVDDYYSGYSGVHRGFPAMFLRTAAGAAVDSSTWTAFTTGGTATPAEDHPIGVAFYEGRLWFLGTDQRPNTIFGSRAPSDVGASRFDDFTGGTDPDHACFFALAPVNGSVDVIVWGLGTPSFLAIGAYGGMFRVTGSGLDEPITPDSINVKQIDAYGCRDTAPAFDVRPFYIQRGGRRLRSIRYDVDASELRSYDMNLNAEHIGASALERVVVQHGNPGLLWVVRADGVLAGMTVEGAENVAGWHRHEAGGVDTAFIDAAVLPQDTDDDQLWAVVKRTVDGVVRHSVEFLTADVEFPGLLDFYSGQANEAADLASWQNAVYRRQEEYIHLDAAATYNGADRGTAAAATLTPGAVTGDGIAFTASAAVFRAGDVGNELWKKPDRVTGVGAGRATITAYVSPTEVTCDITVDFDAVTAIAAGSWHIAADEIYVPHLDGEEVMVVIDGALYDEDEQTVTDGKIVLDAPAAVVHIGYRYEGVIRTHNLDLAVGPGPAQAKPRNIISVFIRFLNSLGVDFGPNLYDLETLEWRTAGDPLDRPVPVFSGLKPVPTRDSWTREEGKHINVVQRLPLPCVIQGFDINFDAAEDS